MIFRKIKITGQKDLSVSIPESWADVTFKQFVALANEKEPIERLSILTGIPSDLFVTYPDLADFYVWVETKLAWSNDWAESKSKGELFNIKGEQFHFPKEIGILSIGLYEDMKATIQEKVEGADNDEDRKLRQIETYPLICAAYYQLHRDGEYNYLKAEELVKVFENEPCEKVINCGGFFLNKVESLRNGTKKEPRNLVTRTTKFLQGLIGYPKSLELKQSSLN